MAMVGISLPIWRGKLRAGVAEALLEGRKADFGSLVEDAPIIPEIMDALDAVEVLKASPIHMGLVYDEGEVEIVRRLRDQVNPLFLEQLAAMLSDRGSLVDGRWRGATDGEVEVPPTRAGELAREVARCGQFEQTLFSPSFDRDVKSELMGTIHTPMHLEREGELGALARA